MFRNIHPLRNDIDSINLLEVSRKVRILTTKFCERRYGLMRYHHVENKVKDFHFSEYKINEFGKLLNTPFSFLFYIFRLTRWNK